MFDVHTERFLLQVAYMSVTGHHLISAAQKFFYGTGLSGRLYYYQIILHIFRMKLIMGTNVEKKLREYYIIRY